MLRAYEHDFKGAISFASALISTIDTNIGDDFIRTGLLNVIRSLRRAPFDTVLINKHQPYSVFRNPAAAEALGKKLMKLPRPARLNAFRFAGGRLPSRFDDCDLILQCGTPVLWPGCDTAEWNLPIWQAAVAPLHRQVPVLNLAGGSLFAWTNPPERINSWTDRRYLRSTLDYCRLTTARDPLGAKLLSEIGGKAVECVPCSAALAADPMKSPPGDLILINYMPGGGHFSFGQPLAPEAWENSMIEAAEALSQRFRLRFIAHNTAEADAAARLFPQHELVHAKTVDDYVVAAAGARAGLVNRLHAAVFLAGDRRAVGCGRHRHPLADGEGIRIASGVRRRGKQSAPTAGAAALAG